MSISPHIERSRRPAADRAPRRSGERQEKAQVPEQAHTLSIERRAMLFRPLIEEARKVVKGDYLGKIFSSSADKPEEFQAPAASQEELLKNIALVRNRQESMCIVLEAHIAQIQDISQKITSLEPENEQTILALTSLFQELQKLKETFESALTETANFSREKYAADTYVAEYVRQISGYHTTNLSDSIERLRTEQQGLARDFFGFGKHIYKSWIARLDARIQKLETLQEHAASLSVPEFRLSADTGNLFKDADNFYSDKITHQWERDFEGLLARRENALSLLAQSEQAPEQDYAQLVHDYFELDRQLREYFQNWKALYQDTLPEQVQWLPAKKLDYTKDYYGALEKPINPYETINYDALQEALKADETSRKWTPKQREELKTHLFRARLHDLAKAITGRTLEKQEKRKSLLNELFEFKSADAISILLLNAFTDRGSGLLSLMRNKDNSSLYDYLSSLTPKELKAAALTPGCSDLITLLLAHEHKPVMRADTPAATHEEESLKKERDTALSTLLCHALGSADEYLRILAIQAMQDIQYPPPETYASLAAHALGDLTTRERDELFHALTYRAPHDIQSREILFSMLEKNSRALPPVTQTYLKDRLAFGAQEIMSHDIMPIENYDDIVALTERIFSLLLGGYDVSMPTVLRTATESFTYQKIVLRKETAFLKNLPEETRRLLLSSLYGDSIQQHQWDTVSLIQRETGVAPTEYSLLRQLENRDDFADTYAHVVSFLPDAAREIHNHILNFLKHHDPDGLIETYETINATHPISPEELQSVVYTVCKRTDWLAKDLEAFKNSVIMDTWVDVETMQRALMENLTQCTPSLYAQTFQKIKMVFPYISHAPWGECFQRMESLQARTEHEKHDPWKTDLDPLVQQTLKNKTLDPARTEDGEILFSFIQEYGMYNLPTLLRWHAALMRAGRIEDVDPEICAEIEHDVGISLDKIKGIKSLGAEIKKVRAHIQAELLADGIPEQIVTTKIGNELFLSLKGDTRWGTNDDLKTLLDTWRKSLAANPTLGVSPQGYKEVILEIAEIERTASTDKLERFARKTKEIIENKEVQLWTQRFVQSFQEARDIESGARLFHEWFAIQKKHILDTIHTEQAEQHAARAKTTKKASHDTIEKKLIQLSELEERIASLDCEEFFANHAKRDTQFVQLIEHIAELLPKTPERDHILRVLTALHARDILQEQRTDDGFNWIEQLDIISRDGNATIDTGTIRDWADFFISYFREHYLFEKQRAQGHAEHAPFTKKTLKTLQHVWGGQLEPDQHPLVQAAQKLRNLGRSGTVKSEKKIPITMIPARGIFQIFSGDLGDACSTSQHHDLASGKFPGMTTYVFVSGRATSNERLRGSVLFIETQDAEKNSVLAIRANNPHEGLLQTIDSDEFLEEFFNMVKGIAAERGIKKIVIPLDAVSASCSNRPDIASYYKEHFGACKKVRLVNEPATNFNGYQIWDETGTHAVVDITDAI